MYLKEYKYCLLINSKSSQFHGILLIRSNDIKNMTKIGCYKCIFSLKLIFHKTKSGKKLQLCPSKCNLKIDLI